MNEQEDRKMIKLLAFDKFFRHNDILAKNGSTAITLSRQNDAGSRAHYLVLRKSRRRSRSRIIMGSSLSKGVFSQLNRK